MWQGKKVGILGGGQLGAMLIRHAIDYGLKVAVLDKQADAPCANYAGHFTIGDPLCYEHVLAFGRTVEVLTIEKEAVNVRALEQLEREGIQVFPSPSIIGLIADKWIQKNTLQSAGIPVVPGVAVDNKAALYDYQDKLPGCLKLRTQGYDGKGVMMIRKSADIDTAFDAPCVLEELVDIRQELSVIVARNAQGAVACYDPVLMIFDQKRFLLNYQLCPADITPQVADEARNIATRVAQTLALVGILAVEMFVTTEGKVIVNELAPRPHNSGHHTMEACATSQYEQHLRAILGLPLGSPRTLLPSVMVNILEPAAKDRDNREKALETMLGQSDVHLHWYGKAGGHEGRKMGHITITDATMEQALSKGDKIRRLLKPDDGSAQTSHTSTNINTDGTVV